MSALRQYGYRVIRTYGINDINICLVMHNEHAKKDNIFIAKKGDLPELKELTEEQLKTWIDINKEFITQNHLIILRGIYYDGEPLILAEETQTISPISLITKQMQLTSICKYKMTCMKCEAFNEENHVCKIAETNINNLRPSCPIDKWH